MFWYDEKMAFKTTLYSFKNDHITDEVVWWYGWNQHKRTYGLVYHSEWHFDGSEVADEILKPHVVPYSAVTGNTFRLIQDKARAHTACLVENLLEDETVWLMDGTACSPDLNPIEYAQNTLGWSVVARSRPPITVQDSKIAFLQECGCSREYSIPQSLIDNLIASIPNRCSTVLLLRGDHTPC